METATFETMRAVKENYHAVAMKIPGAHATSIGRKQVDGEFTDTIAICIHLTEKRPLDQIPEAERIPKEIQGFPTDVREDSPPEFCAAVGGGAVEAQQRYAKVPGGAHIVAANDLLWGKSGTLGCYVMDSTDNKTVYGLTCAHVMGNYSKIFQPDNTNFCNLLGAPVRTNADVDAGIFSLGSWLWDNNILQIGAVAGTRTLGYSDFGKKVVKYGSTTGLTTGVINNTDYLSKVNIGNGISIANTIIIVPETKGGVFGGSGDSGSAVVYQSTESGMEGNFVIGVLFAISTDSSNEVFVVPINRILEKLKVSIVTGKNTQSDNDTLYGRVEAMLSWSARGKDYLNLYQKHFSSILEMFSSNPRLHATWLKIPGADFIGAVHAGLNNPDSKIPSTLGDMDTAVVLDTLHTALTGYAKTVDNLPEQLSSLTAALKANIGKSWREAFAEGS